MNFYGYYKRNFILINSRCYIDPQHWTSYNSHYNRVLVDDIVPPRNKSSKRMNATNQKILPSSNAQDQNYSPKLLNSLILQCQTNKYWDRSLIKIWLL